MKIYAKKLLSGGKWLTDAVVEVEGGFVRGITAGTDGDLKTDIMTSGLLDKHQHGAYGFDCTHPDDEAAVIYADYLARHGVTDYLYTLGAGPIDVTANAVAYADALREKDLPGAKARGVHLEGPFVNPVRGGAMRKDCMIPPTLEAFGEIAGDHKDFIRAITVAPELEGAFEFAEKMSADGIRVQAGHTDADYKIIEEAAKHGFTGFTHTFNAMRGILHRDPGPEVYGLLHEGFILEAICDFVHLAPEIIQMMFRLKGGRGIAMVSDSGMVAGMPEGVYTAGNHYVRVENGRCFTKTGGISGSYRQLDTGVTNLVSVGIAAEEVIEAASATPAEYLGLDDIGDIAPGKKAHFALWNERFECTGSFIEDRLFEAK